MKGKNSKKCLIIESIIKAVIATIIVYLILGPLNNEFTYILQNSLEKDLAVTTSLIMFIPFLVISVIVNFIEFYFKEK